MTPCGLHQASNFVLRALLLTSVITAASQAYPVDNGEFALFVEKSLSCADYPVPSLLFVSRNVETRLGTLNVEAKWLSKQPRSFDDITVCTNSNFERLHMLEAQCKSWGGPVSAAVYMPLLYFDKSNSAIIDGAIQQLDRLHERIERAGTCQLDIVLLSELLQPENLWSYPYNSLRNQAIARTRTKLLVLLDVDFLLRRGFREHLLQPDNFQALLVDTYMHKDVVVLPAFETKQGVSLDEGMEIAMKAFRSTKKTVKYMHKKGNVTQFAPFYRRGHTATDYKQWFSSEIPYPISYEAGFEPFVLISRMHVPWYDERFRGYGWDKITHIFQMDQLGFNLVVHPHGFVVHRPHPPSAGYNATFTGPAYTKGHKPTENMAQLNRVAKDMMNDVKKGRYPLYGVTALAGCRRLEVFSSDTQERNYDLQKGEVASKEEGFTRDQQDKLRNQDPIAGWW